jgi:hypothetical protein
VFNNISKIITPDKLKVPAISVMVSVGILGLSYAAEQNKELFSSTNLAVNYLVPTTQNNISSQSDVLSKLRNIKEQRTAETAGNTYQIAQNSPNKLPEDITKLSTNIRELERNGNTNKLPDQDGIYVYGQSSKPNESGKGYIVLQKQQGKISGALYVPQSELSCFQGTITKSGELAMTVNSSPGEVGVMQVSTTSNIPKINDQESTSYAYSVNLQSYHQLNSVSQQDQDILQMCQRETGGFQ